MKTIVEINSTNYASTGNIMLNIASEARKEGFDVYTCCKASKESSKHLSDNQITIGYRFERILSSLINTLTGLRDHCNIIGTYSFISKLKKIKPDLIHLHTMHDDFINVRIFFDYLSKANIPVIWTFHDCCAMTGTCPYFDMVGCEKWKTGCHNCPQLHGDTNSLLFDTSKNIWEYRKKYFTSVNNMTVVTPSVWLSDIVKQSFFNKYNVEVINNGINLNKFKPVDSDFKETNNMNNKYLVLGIANIWGKRKGLNVFIELSKSLPDNYQIVMVGTNDEIDKQLSENIISIHRTYNQDELIKIYSSADVFVNPTSEDNFPTVNIESLACGTPVITFKTGGSPEIIDNTCGVVVEKDDISTMKEEIIRICETKPYTKNACIQRSKSFDMANTFKQYIELYKKLLNH